MKVTYRFKLDQPVRIIDHWPVTIGGGSIFDVVEQDGLVIAVDVAFPNQSVEQAPTITRNPEGSVPAANFHLRDTMINFAEYHLRQAFSFLGCIFHVSIKVDDYTVFYEAETEDERPKIVMSQWTSSADPEPVTLPYDLLTRSIFVAENNAAPTLEASLAASAREALFRQNYIDSFRYSFLLVEAAYGEGKFKTRDLNQVLRTNRELVSFVVAASRRPPELRWKRASPTAELISSRAAPEALIEHLVEMRGFYFHSHRKGKSRWDPSEQREAEALAVFAVDVAQSIAFAAAGDLFDPQWVSRHFHEAERSGATIEMLVEFEFWTAPREFAERQTINVRMPGTKVTSQLAQQAMKHAIELFERNRPDSVLKSVVGKDGEGNDVFRVTISAPDAPTQTFDAPFHQALSKK